MNRETDDRDRVPALFVNACEPCHGTRCLPFAIGLAGASERSASVCKTLTLASFNSLSRVADKMEFFLVQFVAAGIASMLLSVNRSPLFPFRAEHNQLSFKL